MKTLQEIFNEIGHFGSDIGCNDKGGTHSYIETYDGLFSKKRDNCSILEIGLALGDSIKLFDRYFNNSKIVGCDISVIFDYKEVNENNNSVRIIEHDATKSSFLSQIADEKFDFIIDDGSHMELDQIQTFMMLKHKMKPGGVYIIEDILAIDQNAGRFKALHDNCTIIDLRSKKGRFDDVLIIYQF